MVTGIGELHPEFMEEEDEVDEEEEDEDEEGVEITLAPLAETVATVFISLFTSLLPDITKIQNEYR